nr:proline-rich receptor-like protein kinase PERK8 [Lolium perenne]
MVGHDSRRKMDKTDTFRPTKPRPNKACEALPVLGPPGPDSSCKLVVAVVSASPSPDNLHRPTRRWELATTSLSPTSLRLHNLEPPPLPLSGRIRIEDIIAPPPADLGPPGPDPAHSEHDTTARAPPPATQHSSPSSLPPSSAEVDRASTTQYCSGDIPQPLLASARVARRRATTTPSRCCSRPGPSVGTPWHPTVAPRPVPEEASHAHPPVPENKRASPPPTPARLCSAAPSGSGEGG